MGIFIAAALFIIIAIVIWYLILDKKKLLHTIAELPRRSISEIIHSADSGTFHSAKIRGKVVAADILKSELAQVPCVYYEMKVLRRYSKRERETSSSESTHYRTVTREDVVAHNVREREFYIDDGTGKLKVSLKGAKFDKDKVVDQYKPVDNPGMEIEFGNFRFGLGNTIGGESTLGYHYQEWAVPVDREVFAAGGIKKDGEVYLTVPDDSRYKYFISFLHEDTLVIETKKSIFWSMIATVLCLLCGISALLYGLVQQSIIPV